VPSDDVTRPRKKKHVAGFVGTLGQDVGWLEPGRVWQVEGTFDGLDTALSADVVNICRFGFEEDVVEQRFLTGLDCANEDVGRTAVLIVGDLMLAHELKQRLLEIDEDGLGAFSGHAFTLRSMAADG
jgi:hypothetical protein